MHTLTLAAAMALALAPLLGGCASPQEIAARDAQRCLGAGFSPGTQAFANCRLQIQLTRYAARPRVCANNAGIVTCN